MSSSLPQGSSTQYYPPPFHRTQRKLTQLAMSLHLAMMAHLPTAKMGQAKREELQREREEEALYSSLKEMAPINLADRRVTFCCHFKYLGSYVSFTLCNDYDIDKRIAAASQSMGALKTMWDCPHLEIWTKYLLFRSTPMSQFLWRYKTRLMQKVLRNKLEVFLCCSIWRIL